MLAGMLKRRAGDEKAITQLGGQFLKDKGVKMNLRVDHGMTHSVYINDPNGYGVEVLYELPEEIWKDDIDGALNYAVVLPEEDLFTETEYTSNFN